MTKEEFITAQKNFKQQIREIELKAYQAIDPIKEQIAALKQGYINELLLQYPHIKIGAQFKYGKDLVHIYEIFLDSYNHELSVKLKKVKKDGTNGDAIANSYGTSITKLKEIA